MKIFENVALAGLTTMRLGGPARYVVEIERPDEVKAACDFAQERQMPCFVLGGGANTIAHDEGFAGVVIRNVMTGIADNDGELTIMGGTMWDDVVTYACGQGYTGIEALAKIPGLAGAAPVQNIGAYGQEVADTFVVAEVYDMKEGISRKLTKEDFGFAYRKSILNTTARNRYFVISISLRLKKGQMERPFYNSLERYLTEHRITDVSPESISRAVATIRADKLPDPTERASAGSFFKNIYLTDAEAVTAEQNGVPVYHGHDGLKINAGWLIEAAGLKGKLLHGMRISDKAALVLINESATGYADLAAARAEIVAAVRDKFGYTLEQEPVEI